jgi:hypothetical protein
MYNESKEKNYRFHISSILILGCIMTAYAIFGRVTAINENDNRNMSVHSASAVGNNSGSVSRNPGIEYHQGVYPARPGTAEQEAIHNGW